MYSKTFRDFDEFVESVHDVDAEMLLQKPQSRFWRISHINLPDIHIQTGQLGSGNIVEGQSRSDGYLLYMPLTDNCTYSANGTVLNKNAFMILEPGCNFVLSTQVDHNWCSIFVPSHMLDLSSNPVEQLSDSKTICRVTHGDYQLAHQFQTLLRQIKTAAECSQFEASYAAACAEANLLKVASQVIGNQQRGEPYREGRPRVPRQEIFRRCKAFIEQCQGKPIRVEDLAAISEVSERTLRTAFNEYFGIGPSSYLQMRQINQVQRILRAADPEEESVTDVLLRHGQWEFGRFAARYRQLYGELPSETLRAKKR